MTGARDLENIYKYHAPQPGQPEMYQVIRSIVGIAAVAVENLCPESREKSLAHTNLEQAVFWANAAIARNDALVNANDVLGDVFTMLENLVIEHRYPESAGETFPEIVAAMCEEVAAEATKLALDQAPAEGRLDEAHAEWVAGISNMCEEIEGVTAARATAEGRREKVLEQHVETRRYFRRPGTPTGVQGGDLLQKVWAYQATEDMREDERHGYPPGTWVLLLDDGTKRSGGNDAYFRASYTEDEPEEG